jgi:hypothetical protein
VCAPTIYSRREAEPPQQVHESWVWAQAVENGFHLEKQQAAGAFRISFLKRFERPLLLGKTCVDYCQVVG